MRTGLKIILIIVAIVVVTLLITLIKAGSGQGTNSPGAGGPIGLIVILALIAGIRAIWKYNPDKKDETLPKERDKHQLDKE